MDLDVAARVVTLAISRRTDLHNATVVLNLKVASDRQWRAAVGRGPDVERRASAVILHLHVAVHGRAAEVVRAGSVADHGRASRLLHLQVPVNGPAPNVDAVAPLVCTLPSMVDAVSRRLAPFCTWTFPSTVASTSVQTLPDGTVTFPEIVVSL